MPRYRYRASRADGDLFEGVVDAVTADAASDMIWSQGLMPFEVRKIADGRVKWWQREIFSSSSSLAADVAAFTRQFSTLNAADVPLDDALRILSDQAYSPRVRTLVAGLLEDILGGATLSEAMKEQAGIFSAEYISMVRAGEIGGTLDQVFAELADLLERRMEIRASIQSALIYPCLVIALGLGTLVIIVGALVPSIAPIFVENGKEMPATVRVLLALHAMWLQIAVAMAVVALGLIGTLSIVIRRPAVRVVLDRYKLKVPILGQFLLQQETARFARTLGTLLKVGVPLVQAAKSGRDVIGNSCLGASVDRAIEAAQQGVPLHRALGKEAELPPIALQMISVGEESGKLGVMLVRVAAMLEGQIRNSTDRFMAAFTPMLTVGIALMVGALIMPVMNAVLSINDLVAQ